MFQVGRILRIQQVFEESDVRVVVAEHGALVVDMEHLLNVEHLLNMENLKKAIWTIVISDITSRSYVEYQDVDGST